MRYRKLTKQECERFGIQYKPYPKVVEHVLKYYGKEAFCVLIGVDNEYNDEGYDSKVGFFIVYDKNNNELLPVKGREVEARTTFPEIPFYDEYGDYHEEIANFFIPIMADGCPELYVKEEDG